jgi:ubiquinone/menaquinone biosynthesis C-methylase UbiE
MLVLDLGCGSGNPPVRANLSAEDEIVGIDLNEASLAAAQRNFPERMFVRARGEQLPFRDGQFDRVVAAVALPYMNIAKALTEVHRVLTDRGTVFFSVHPPGFTLRELQNAFPMPAATFYRCWVLLNGVSFHLFGLNWAESFQTERGMKIALVRSGFTAIAFQRPTGRLLVEATKA